jgi:tetratricopeptide (TPR) repeat protein
MRTPAVAVMLLLAVAPLCRAGQAPSRPATQPAPVPDRAVLLAQAADAERAGHTDRAMQLLRLAASRHESVRAWLELARLQLREQQTAAALESLSSARDIAPNSEEVLSAYAQVALAARLPLPAVLTLAPLTRMCPGVAEYQYLLGVGLMALGDMPNAADALREADRLEPDRPLTLLALGLALNNRKLFAEARTVLSRSLDLEPDKPEAVAALAEAEAGMGELETAEAHARRALERAPANATANLVIGLVAVERRDYPAARDALLAASQADPDAPKVLYQLSLVFARLGDDASSRRYVDRYQAKQKEVEDRIAALRAGGAFSPGRPPR